MPHQAYIVNGVQWPSATELTNLLPQPWIMAWYKSQVKAHGWRGWLKCLATSKRGMRIGTDVHGLIESFIIKTQYETNPKYNSQAYADALYDAVNPLVEDYVAIEPHLKDESLKIHGTADVIVRIVAHPGLWVGDWKTSASKSETHPIQLAIYAMCWNAEHSDQKIDMGFIARVDKKSKKLGVKIDYYLGLKKYFPIVLALRQIWDYQNKQGGWNKDILEETNGL